MAYKGTAHEWLRNIGRMEEHANWTEAPRSPDPPQEAQRVLEEIKCPECEGTQSTNDHKLYSKIGFSQIKCQTCQEVNIAMKWCCTCGIKWHKCGMRLRRISMYRFSPIQSSPMICSMPSKGGSMSQEHGVDRPMPKKRHLNGTFVEHTLHVEERGFYSRTRHLPKGSHHV